MSRAKIDFIDLKAQRRHIGSAMDEAILNVVHDGNYILGPEVKRFEDELAAFCGAKHAIGCANGTDAIALPLMAMKLRPGDAVICPSFTFAATAAGSTITSAALLAASLLGSNGNATLTGAEAATEAMKHQEGLAVISVQEMHAELRH